MWMCSHSVKRRTTQSIVREFVTLTIDFFLGRDGAGQDHRTRC